LAAYLIKGIASHLSMMPDMREHKPPPTKASVIAARIMNGIGGSDATSGLSALSSKASSFLQG